MDGEFDSREDFDPALSRLNPQPITPGPLFGPDRVETCASEGLPCELYFLEVPGFSGAMPYYTFAGFGDLSSPQENEVVERVIIAIHGSFSNESSKSAGLDTFESYWEGMKLMVEEGEDLPSTMIVAPMFQNEVWKPWDQAWCWKSGWNKGNRSAEQEGLDRISSFRVIDEFLRQVHSKYPNAQAIVLSGHSGGGQCVHRYAMLSTGVHDELEADGINIRHVVMNPGRYTYFSLWRKVGDVWQKEFDCEPHHDCYPLGLDSRSLCQDTYWPPDPNGGSRLERAWAYSLENYPGIPEWAIQPNIELGPVPQTLVAQNIMSLAVAAHAQYARRDVWHLVSKSDNDPNSENLPEGCGEDLQGAHRLQRFRNFLASLAVWTPFGPSAQLRFREVITDDPEGEDGHNTNRMLKTSEARDAIFVDN